MISTAETLTRRYNDTILTSVPRSITGNASRSRETYACFWVPLSAFIAARDHGRAITAQRSLEAREIEAIAHAAEENRQIQSPAGIAGFDLVSIRGERLVNLSRASGKLTRVSYSWSPPRQMRPAPDSDTTIPMGGTWIMECQFTLHRCRTSKTLAQHQNAEAETRLSATAKRRRQYA